MSRRGPSRRGDCPRRRVAGVRLRGPGRRVCVRLLAVHPARDDGPGGDHVADLAHPPGRPAASGPARDGGEPGQARGGAGARRAGPGADRAAHGRGRAAALRAAPRPGRLPAAPDHAPGRVAGRLVVVPDRLQPRQAPHLRLPHPQPPVAPAGALLGAGGAAAAGRYGWGRSAWPSAGRASARAAAASRSGRRWATTASPARFLRVPITFPAEPFNGALLSAMSVPDLRGSQGTYCYFSSDPGERRTLTSGERIPVQWVDGVARGVITGPGQQPAGRRRRAAAPVRGPRRRERRRGAAPRRRRPSVAAPALHALDPVTLQAGGSAWR